MALTGNGRHTNIGSEQPQLQQQQSNDSDFKPIPLSDEEGKEEKKREELDLLPGSGPGGVPQKYFNVSSIPAEIQNLSSCKMTDSLASCRLFSFSLFFRS